MPNIRGIGLLKILLVSALFLIASLKILLNLQNIFYFIVQRILPPDRRWSLCSWECVTPSPTPSLLASFFVTPLKRRCSSFLTAQSFQTWYAAHSSMGNTSTTTFFIWVELGAFLYTANEWSDWGAGISARTVKQVRQCFLVQLYQLSYYIPCWIIIIVVDHG